jgi:hypothetical protein
MNYDRNKVDDMLLALLHLTAFDDGGYTGAWKGHDWDVMERLHKSGCISDPMGKAKSVALTEEGERRAQELFERYFGLSR